MLTVPSMRWTFKTAGGQKFIGLLATSPPGLMDGVINPTEMNTNEIVALRSAVSSLEIKHGDVLTAEREELTGSYLVNDIEDDYGKPVMIFRVTHNPNA